MQLKPTITLAFLCIAASTLTGCVTSALWEEGRFMQMHEPASPPNLRLFFSRNSEVVLVQYDEWTEGKDSTKRRSYWIHLKGPQAKNPHRPRFVSAKEARGLAEIPPQPELSKTDPWFAVEEVYPTGFSLHLPNRDPARYELPVFDDASGLTKQILLTPFAVTADATIVGGCLALIYVGWGWNCWNDPPDYCR